MIGIFDSGVGGLNALAELSRLAPRESICYLADTKNAPYGTKSRGELIRLVRRDIDTLRSLGADRILIACCTACTVYSALPEKYREGVVPIIAPTARRAVELTQNRKIAVLCTYATEKSLAFVSEIAKLDRDISVTVKPSARLVELVEGGARDGSLSEAERAEISLEISPVLASGADTVILGCTHFTHIRGEIERMTGMRAVSAAHIGAHEMIKMINAGRQGISRCP